MRSGQLSLLPLPGQKSVVAYGLRGEGLVWLVGAVVYICRAAPQVQLLAIAGNG